ncbi:N-6 DNA methylase [Lujinxingia litoralis]|uniref:N-6 DNA methylase n=1 Tax=Lujinxingia litoralis TaxID=2211119 RepID=UPI0013147B3F|nr:N-6 DNA methylase [Lujinxingia litoralis]
MSRQGGALNPAKKVASTRTEPGGDELWQALARAVMWEAAVCGMPTPEIVRRLEQVVEGASVERLRQAILTCEASGLAGKVEADGERWDALLGDAERRAFGVHFTPAHVADRLVSLLDDGEESAVAEAGLVVDPACGAGALLLAAGRRWPGRALVGVEREEGLALACGLRLLAAQRRGEAGDVRVIVGDGLDRLEDDTEGRAGVVVMNPPYVPEKGNGAFLAGVLADHPRFECVRGARVDLLYYFLARSVELLSDGGQAAWLTPPHWLGADGADALRAYLLDEGAMERFAWLKAGDVFDAAPGTEVLLASFRKGSARREAMWGGSVSAGEFRWTAVAPGSLGSGRWRPRVDQGGLDWGRRVRREGRPLGELVRDFQGVVSGADRVTRRHVAHFGGVEEGWEVGTPIFLSEEAEPPAGWAVLGGYVRPLLRSGRLEASRVYRGEEVHGWMLYLCEELPQEHLEAVEEVLGPYRPILERRREVVQGKMPWYRLHWPRDRAAMAAPKLVVPRRAPRPCFALDLSGAIVSSDCTILLAPPDIEDAEGYLCALMKALNSAHTERYLGTFGKRKGALLEFYSSPLRELPVRFEWP